MTTTERLIKLIQKEQCFGIDNTSKQFILDAMYAPDWVLAGRVHDWRNHVTNELQEIWNSLSLETRLAVTFRAMRSAEQELWD
jgi:hypothetical protein